MFERWNETKVMRDPIHEYIRVDLKIIWDCINAKEFQRLRRIHQLGGTFQVYHSAEHSRFSHSLGVYEIVRRMVSEIDELRKNLSEYDKVTVMLAALLHDTGHGPFSHAFEAICSTNHEEFTKRILLEKSELNQIMSSVDEKIPNDVASIIDHTHPNQLLVQLVSGQLDADRMDYLLRDAYFTGTKYGEFDLERMLRTLRIKEGKVVVKESGIHTVEDYIMARYHMYWQVYYHPVARSFESVLVSLFRRLKWLSQNDPQQITDYPMFMPFLQDKTISIREHYLLDEPACYYGFSCMAQSTDPILKDLSNRLMNRKLFEFSPFTQAKQAEDKKALVARKGFDPDYYFFTDQAQQKPYQPYQSIDNSLIWVLMNDGEIEELSEASVIVNALVHGKNKTEALYFYPKEIME